MQIETHCLSGIEQRDSKVSNLKICESTVVYSSVMPRPRKEKKLFSFFRDERRGRMRDSTMLFQE